MNSKKTNWLVLICSFLLLIVFFNIVKYTSDYMFNYALNGSIYEGKVVSIYGIKVAGIFYSNFILIIIIQFLAVVIPNIVAAIENIKYKRLAICQFLVAVVGVINCIRLNNLEDLFSNELLNAIYTIILTILMILQLIILLRQKENIEESGIRKKVNFVLFYILQLIITIVLLLALLYSLLLSKINETMWDNRVKELSNKITSIDSYNDNDEKLVVVKNNDKYGFVNLNGKEVIPCEYDLVSNFSFIDEEKKYSFALAGKDDKLYAISKNNYKIEINDKLLDNSYNVLLANIEESSHEQYGYFNSSFGKIHYMDYMISSYFKNKLYETQNENVLVSDKYYVLEEKDSKYYYENENFSMEIEKILENEDDEDEYHYNVTVKNKQNNKVTSNEDFVHIDSVIHEFMRNEFTNRLEAYSDGSIGFSNLDEEQIGWYDIKGYRHTMSAKSEEGDFYIRDIKDGKIILEETIGEGADASYPKRILDMNGKTLFESEVLICFSDFFVTLSENEKLIMMDYDLNVISNEYDMIATIDRE